MSLSRSEQARINGAKSRGPKTPEGKAISSMNNLRHGHRARPQSSAPHGPNFQQLLDECAASLAPRSPAEVALVHRFAAARWQTARWKAIETAVLNRLYAQARPDGPENDPAPWATLAAALEASFNQSSLLDLISRRISKHIAAQNRALRALRQHRKLEALARMHPQTATLNTTTPNFSVAAARPQFRTQPIEPETLIGSVPETGEPNRSPAAPATHYPAIHTPKPPHPPQTAAAPHNFFSPPEIPQIPAQPSDPEPLTPLTPKTGEPNRTAASTVPDETMATVCAAGG